MPAVPERGKNNYRCKKFKLVGNEKIYNTTGLSLKLKRANTFNMRCVGKHVDWL